MNKLDLIKRVKKRKTAIGVTIDNIAKLTNLDNRTVSSFFCWWRYWVKYYWKDYKTFRFRFSRKRDCRCWSSKKANSKRESSLYSLFGSRYFNTWKTRLKSYRTWNINTRDTETVFKWRVPKIFMGRLKIITLPFSSKFKFNHSAKLFNFSLTLFSPKSKSHTSLTDKILTYTNYKEESIPFSFHTLFLQVVVILAKYFLSFKLEFTYSPVFFVFNDLNRLNLILYFF